MTIQGRFDMQFNHLDPTIRESYPRAIAKLASRDNALREQILLVKIRSGFIALTGNMIADVEAAKGSVV